MGIELLLRIYKATVLKWNENVVSKSYWLSDRRTVGFARVAIRNLKINNERFPLHWRNWRTFVLKFPVSVCWKMMKIWVPTMAWSSNIDLWFENEKTESKNFIKFWLSSWLTGQTGSNYVNYSGRTTTWRYYNELRWPAVHSPHHIMQLSL